MNILTEQDITAEVARDLRKSSGLNQTKFWEGVGSSQESGHHFENGKRIGGIPKPIRTLIFLKHVAGMPVEVSTTEGAASVVKYGQEVAAKIEAERAAEAAAEAQRVAKAAQKKARELSA